MKLHINHDIYRDCKNWGFDMINNLSQKCFYSQNYPFFHTNGSQKVKPALVPDYIQQ